MSKIQKNEFDISGKVLSIGGVEQISDKFSKRVLIVEVFNGKYANNMPFEFANQSMDQIKDVQPGMWVTVHFALKSFTKSREGEPTRYFVTLDSISCYKE